jgi:hypothetical protein
MKVQLWGKLFVWFKYDGPVACNGAHNLSFVGRGAPRGPRGRVLLTYRIAIYRLNFLLRLNCGHLFFDSELPISLFICRKRGMVFPCHRLEGIRMIPSPPAHFPGFPETAFSTPKKRYFYREGTLAFAGSGTFALVEEYVPQLYPY